MRQIVRVYLATSRSDRDIANQLSIICCHGSGTEFWILEKTNLRDSPFIKNIAIYIKALNICIFSRLGCLNKMYQ
ncbi:hypothetical protein FKM82_015664 [Ascaphus truei]